MKLNEKLKAVTDSAVQIDLQVSGFFAVAPGVHGTHQVLRSFMTAEQLMLWDLAEFWEKEALACQAAGAHFSTMVCSVSMNEALLALALLMNSEPVASTKRYQSLTSGKGSVSVLDMLGNFKLEHMIGIASELDWLPSHLIDAETRSLLADVFTEMTTDQVAGGFELEAEDLLCKLNSDAGVAMLRLTQDIRNYVHPNRWLRKQRTVNPSSFHLWCQIAVRLSNEIRAVLMVRMLSCSKDQVRAMEASITKLIANLNDKERALFDKALREKLATESGVLFPTQQSVLEFFTQLCNAF